MKRAAACAFAFILGCTADIRLGDLPSVGGPEPMPDGSVFTDAGPAVEIDGGTIDAGTPDSGPWVPPRPLPPDGRYRLSYLPGAEVRCEALDPFSFSTLTATQAGLTDGEIVILLRGTVLEVSGPPMRAGFGVSTLNLTQTATEGVHLGEVPLDHEGPKGTRATEGRLRMDIEVPAPLPPETEAQIRYEVEPDGPWCEVVFRALLTREDGG